jgi:predicted DCC family thiol-disulfide oxidoreductase YuxK
MPTSIKLAARERPLMIYDGECAFCRARIEWWREATGERIEYAPYQEPKGDVSRLDRKELGRAVHLIDVDGTVSRGAAAVFRAMARCRYKRWLLWLYTMLPPFAWASELVYRIIAANRGPITRVYRLWHGGELRPNRYHISSALFLRFLGVVYLIAFVSFWTQVDGLIGERGILPAKGYLDGARQYFAEQTPPASAVWNLPTLAWMDSSDRFLHGLCAAGAVCSVLLIVGVLPMPMLVALWLLYLSVFHVGQTFMSFQWDILLCETGFVAIFVAPFVWRSRLFRDPHPSRLAVFLGWWVLFRLMFESGAVKLTWNIGRHGADGGPIANTWSSLTALDFHYWTQPLPVWTSWYADKLPHWFQKVSVLFVFVVELLLPWFIFGPRPMRHIAFWGISLLMFLIAATGNYNFFNLLALAMAITLLDDRAWPKFLRSRIAGRDWPMLASPTRWRSFFLVPFALYAIVCGGRQVIDAVAPTLVEGRPIESKWNVDQFLLVNGYGLFRQMTETRPEIVIEASDDGTDWKPYEFRWKPGDLARRPGFNTPHQPRLDWQMWFESLRLEEVYKVTGTIDPRNMDPWFQSFLMRLMNVEPVVVGLLVKAPFEKAPKFIRIVFYQYRFTDVAEGRQTGNWWHREPVWVGPAWAVTP